MLRCRISAPLGVEVPTRNCVFHMAALDYRLTAADLWAFLVWLYIPRRSGQSEPSHFSSFDAVFLFICACVRLARSHSTDRTCRFML